MEAKNCLPEGTSSPSSAPDQPMRKGLSSILSVSRLPRSGPFNTPDPFLFCVYHKDHYPAGDAKMQAPRKGNGADFNPDAPYRMYHGDRIPGFPQHPHRGFETVTATIEGLVDHSDSTGSSGRYGQGDLQWMTAGKGIVHGEMFPLIKQDGPNHLRFFQIWLNLPKKNKMVDPHFKMHWAEQIPQSKSKDGKTSITVWAGELDGTKALTPPPDSYASQPGADVAIFHITMDAGASYVLPPAKGGAKTNRILYFIEGDSVRVAGKEGKEVSYHSEINVAAETPLELSNTSVGKAEFLMLQGRPIGEPVVQHGPFVMNTRAEIVQAFHDYQRTRFGGWPWPEDAVVFPAEKGRFAQEGGKAEETPPSVGSAKQT